MRVNVVGTSGSGKSTFGRALAERMGVRFIEIDEIYWKPQWTEPDDAEFFEDLRQALAGDAWVVDGNYSRALHIKWERVDKVIWLDMPYWLTLYQVITRTLKRSIYRQELWAGNRETLTKAPFSRDSIILWSLTHLRPVRRAYEAAMNSDKYSHIEFIRLRSRDEVNKFLESVQKYGK